MAATQSTHQSQPWRRIFIGTGLLILFFISLAVIRISAPRHQKIAFESSRDGNSEIYVMDADGGNPTRLTDNDAEDKEAKISPDGY